MKTQAFLQLMDEHQDKSLLFEYVPNRFVKPNYHITEVKHLKIDSVDCGARTDSWNETVVQLWESPKEKHKTEFMTVKKANAIFNKVAGMKPFDPDSEIKIEYSNALFHTAQLFVSDYEIDEDKLIFHLAVEKTDCKAKDVYEVTEPSLEASCCMQPVECC
jgi:hypothetical protein